MVLGPLSSALGYVPPPPRLHLSRLSQAEVLGFVGLWSPAELSVALTNDIVQRDEDIADTMGLLTSNMLFARVSRSLQFLRGWPHRALNILAGGTMAKETAAALRNDLDNFEKVSALARGGDVAAKALVRRSCMPLPAVQQITLALKSVDWVPNAKFAKWAEQKQLRLVSSQICEDSFRAMKNNSIIKGRSASCCHTRPPQLPRRSRRSGASPFHQRHSAPAESILSPYESRRSDRVASPDCQATLE